MCWVDDCGSHCLVEETAELEVENAALRLELRVQWEAAHRSWCAPFEIGKSRCEKDPCIWPLPDVLK